jgi:hypothetical protein
MKISRPLFFIFLSVWTLYRLGEGGDRLGTQLACKVFASASDVLPEVSSAAESAADGDGPSCRLLDNESGGGLKIDGNLGSGGFEEAEAAETTMAKDVGSRAEPRLGRTSSSTVGGHPAGAFDGDELPHGTLERLRLFRTVVRTLRAAIERFVLTPRPFSAAFVRLFESRQSSLTLTKAW